MTASLRALLESLIDYAGLFPPANLDMAAAVRNFAEYRTGDHRWALGRFIVPAARLEEFAAAAPPGDPWPLSVLCGPWDRPATRSGMIHSIEIKAESEAAMAPREIDTFYEIASPALLPAVARVKARAKIRTGGVKSEMIPPAEDVVGFIAACAAANVAFKATAGLHHPLRCVRPLTYEPDSASAPMHGFLNVFLAAAFLRGGMGVPDGVTLLQESDPSALRFDDTGVSWRDRRATTAAIAETRKSFALSFGSCSFQEPIDELRELKLL